MPAPHLFGLFGYMPLNEAHQDAEGLKIYPDLANAAGTGSHCDFTWLDHGVPGYLYAERNLDFNLVQQQHYRIVRVEDAGGRQIEVEPVEYTVILSPETADTNVAHNHTLFNGSMPAPHLFGLHGYTPLSQAPEHAEHLKIYPDLANAAGTGPHADFSWILEGVPGYLIQDKKLRDEALDKRHYRIVKVEDAGGRQIENESAEYTVVLAADTAERNVKHNHDLFQGRLPPPHLFGLYGRVPLSQVGDEVPEGTKIWPDLATVNGTSPHHDFGWQLWGIPSYLVTNRDLDRDLLEQGHYQIVPLVASSSVTAQ
ncbi:hypothetical protein PSEUBRA_001713 [Kalmanozyma brasiliensis GHG001]|nr:uncharacterized protein PSEUBRA_001713 [Kalmanozyma brasiliensis GHG001]EST08639.2 hypothetical protein PSEUBRA_001713 [Kalmanozyma brasiliensis GHG001]